MKRILLLTSILTLLVLPALAQQTGTTADDDKAQLIRAILEDGKIYKKYVFANKERPVVYLSSQNIARDLVPAKLGETSLLLKTPEELEKSGLDVYCGFGEFAFKKSTAAVSFYYYTKAFTRIGYNREVLEYEFQKVAGKWEYVSRRHPGLFVPKTPGKDKN